MIAASVGKKQIGKTLLIIVVIIVIIVGAIYFIGKGKGGSGETGGAIKGATAEEREAYLVSIGLQVDATSAVADVGVPEEWDERFTEYNETLKSTGFDLEGLKGKTLKKCTYTVTNRDDIGASVSAVLLVYDDEIVAGHLVDNAKNKIYPLFDVEAETKQDVDPETAEETILPSEAVENEVDDEQKNSGETQKDPEEATKDVETGAYPTE